MKSNKIWTVLIPFALISSLYNPISAQGCTRLVMTYGDFFNKVNLDPAAQKLLDNVLIKFYKKLPEKFEKTDKILNDLQEKAYAYFPDTIKQKISFKRLSSRISNLQEFYTIEKNGYSKAFNKYAENYMDLYHLDGISQEGMEIFVYQYLNHFDSLFNLEYDAFSPVSPVVLKGKALKEYEKYLSSDDLLVFAKGWDIKIQEFVKKERLLDSVYLEYLNTVSYKIDSLKEVDFMGLTESCDTLINLLTEEDKLKWIDIGEQYIIAIKADQIRTLSSVKEYNGDFAPNITRFYQYYFELKLLFPSSNYWMWRSGPKLILPNTFLNSSSECLNTYKQFEKKMVDFITKNQPRIGFPNYYFSGSHKLSEEDIKRIQITNALLFSVLEMKRKEK
jgi:hypothetical protein